MIPLLLLAAWFGGRAWYFSPRVAPQETAANFTAVRADGHRFELADLKGKFVLLDFWGSWCGPCRRESPHLARLHAAYGDRLTIVSIASEQDSSRWRRARTQDARSWPHQVMDATTSRRFLNGPITTLYGVRKLPTNLLLDPQLTVLGIDVPLAEIPAKLR